MFAKQPLGLLESQIFEAIDGWDGVSESLLTLLHTEIERCPDRYRLLDLRDSLIGCMKSGSGCDKEDLRIIAENSDDIGFGAEYTLISTSIM